MVWSLRGFVFCIFCGGGHIFWCFSWWGSYSYSVCSLHRTDPTDFLHGLSYSSVGNIPPGTQSFRFVECHPGARIGNEVKETDTVDPNLTALSPGQGGERRRMQSDHLTDGRTHSNGNWVSERRNIVLWTCITRKRKADRG